ncbi:hypothetical protein BJ165DRAFT_1365824, partial [Panaeolus papilionaceus]
MPRASTSTSTSTHLIPDLTNPLFTIKPEPVDDDEYNPNLDHGEEDDYDDQDYDEDDDGDQLLSDDAPTPTQRLNAFGLDELPESRIRKVKVVELFDALQNDEIVLDPPYQRDVVWNLPKRTGLIDSIFRNFYIPPLVFAIHTVQTDGDDEQEDAGDEASQSNDKGGGGEGSSVEDGEIRPTPTQLKLKRKKGKKEIRICVDGKQRLTSIRNFMEGKIPFKHTALRKSFWYTDAPESSSDDDEPEPPEDGEGPKEKKKKGKPKRHILPQRFREVFDGKEMTVVEYRHLTDPLERDLFRRVQLGMSLNSAEKLQAISSPWADWITSLENKYLHSPNGLGSMITMDTSRGRGFMNLTQMIWACEGYRARNPTSTTTPTASTPTSTIPNTAQGAPTYPTLSTFLSRSTSPTAEFKKEIEEVMRGMKEIARDAGGRGWGRSKKGMSARIAPVEFLFMGVTLFVLPSSLLQAHIASSTSIFEFEDGRKKFLDLRTNSVVCRAMWETVREFEERYRMRGV